MRAQFNVSASYIGKSARSYGSLIRCCASRNDIACSESLTPRSSESRGCRLASWRDNPIWAKRVYCRLHPFTFLLQMNISILCWLCRESIWFYWWFEIHFHLIGIRLSSQTQPLYVAAFALRVNFLLILVDLEFRFPSCVDRSQFFLFNLCYTGWFIKNVYSELHFGMHILRSQVCF